MTTVSRPARTNEWCFCVCRTRTSKNSLFSTCCHTNSSRLSIAYCSLVYICVCLARSVYYKLAEPSTCHYVYERVCRFRSQKVYCMSVRQQPHQWITSCSFFVVFNFVFDSNRDLRDLSSLYRRYTNVARCLVLYGKLAEPSTCHFVYERLCRFRSRKVYVTIAFESVVYDLELVQRNSNHKEDGNTSFKTFVTKMFASPLILYLLLTTNFVLSLAMWIVGEFLYTLFLSVLCSLLLSSN